MSRTVRFIDTYFALFLQLVEIMQVVSPALTVSNPVFGTVDETIFNEITRKVRSTPGVSQAYNVGPLAPKAKNGKERSRFILADNICASSPEWRNLSTALTADGSVVAVVQGMFGWAYQWFYTVQCLPKVENRTCQWINEKQAPRTACVTGYNLVPAIVQIDDRDNNGQPQSSFDWRMIRVPGRCECFRVRSPISSRSPTPFGTKLSALK